MLPRLFGLLLQINWDGIKYLKCSRTEVQVWYADVSGHKADADKICLDAVHTKFFKMMKRAKLYRKNRDAYIKTATGKR